MKKFVKVISLLFTILIFTGCSTEKKANSTASSAKTEASSTVDKEKKAKEEKAKEEAKKKEAEKKKQEEIAKKVTEADTAMKAAEANLTDETLAAAKTAIEAIPGGNSELQKRLDTATSNLVASKQQAAQIQNQSSDMPAGWWGTAADWEQAKAQGWTKEDYEQQQRASENESNPTTIPEQDINNLSLSEFVNKYGMTPAAYQAQNGMTPEEALQNTPQDKKTSGEIQSEWLREQGLE